MDDIIDLELEKIDAILEKIDGDPEDAELKSAEIKLWQNIRKKAVEGRRTGIGITQKVTCWLHLDCDMAARMQLTFPLKCTKHLQ